MVRRLFKRLSGWFKDSGKRGFTVKETKVMTGKEYNEKVIIPKAQRLAKKIKKNRFDIKDLDQLGVRVETYKILRKEPGGQELVSKLQKQLEDYWTENELW